MFLSVWGLGPHIAVDRSNMFSSSFVLMNYRRRQEGKVRLPRVPQAHHRAGHHCHGKQVPPGVLRLHLLQEGKPSIFKFTYIWCNGNSSPADVSPTEVSWILRPLDKASWILYPWPNHPLIRCDWLYDGLTSIFIEGPENLAINIRSKWLMGWHYFGIG